MLSKEDKMGGSDKSKESDEVGFVELNGFKKASGMTKASPTFFQPQSVITISVSYHGAVKFKCDIDCRIIIEDSGFKSMPKKAEITVHAKDESEIKQKLMSHPKIVAVDGETTKAGQEYFADITTKVSIIAPLMRP